MRRKLVVIGACILLLVVGVAGTTLADSQGPAPNAGDCDPDGSGWDTPPGEGYGPGPAPNSGDGIPDGPGW